MSLNKTESYLSFRLDKQLFAMEVASVVEILEVPPITFVPKAPDYMKGVINLRGIVLALIDTRLKFGLSPTEIKEETCIIVTEISIKDELMKVGALVDQVVEVIEIDQAELQESPSLEAKYNMEFIKGIFKVEEEFMMVLDLNKAFTAEEVTLVKESEENV